MASGTPKGAVGFKLKGGTGITPSKYNSKKST
jgi:hypothetical protein